MKAFNPKFLTACVLLGGCSFPVYAEIMFSQYIDGASNQKGLEIYNPDGKTVDLSGYSILQYSNGASDKPSGTFALAGNLGPKQKIIVGRSELQAALAGYADKMQFLQRGVSFNGDDALILKKGDKAVDRFGQLGADPGDGWGTAEFNSAKNSLTRIQASNDAGSVNPADPFNLESQWTKWSDRSAYSENLFNGGGSQPVPESISCSSGTTAIADLHSAALDQPYAVRGVITADFRYSNGFNGFFIQTADSKAKAGVNNAIFVYIPASSAVKGGKLGDEVILKGTLSNYKNQLQLQDLSTEVVSCQDNALSLVQPLAVNLPFDSLSAPAGHAPKRYQGMLVKLPQKLTVSENYEYGRFGSVVLTPERHYIPTNLYPAKSAEALALAKQNMLSKIVLDDGYNNQNRTPWLPQNFSAANTLRTGYDLQNVQGILEYRYDQWRIQPRPSLDQPAVSAEKNPRAALPAKDAKQIRVAAFNVLNYDNGAEKGFPTARGASTAAEFDRQHRKIVSALKAMDADVVALMEIANNGYGENSAIANLTKALGRDWKYVAPAKDQLGSDAIAVAVIYNSRRVTPVGSPAVYDDESKMNRVTFLQSFKPAGGGKLFTVIPNHLKSKGSCPKDKASPDADQGDGQGCWNDLRTKSVAKLMQWAAKEQAALKQNANFLLLGDMNSYAKEDPILALEQASYKVLLNDEKVGQGKTAYSYVFGVASNAEGHGGSGNLDHAIADANLYPMVKRAFAWHINADEPTALDYNDEYKTDEQKVLFFKDDPYRSSDHDPVIVDLALNDAAVQPPQDSEKSVGGSMGLFGMLSMLGLAVFAQVRRRKAVQPD
ncbi:ExeM/NucH family extracellular endonuclease [Acinetobacter sp. WCHAc010034]|uniref:ExeM/NucH family extracellular endonuclease n=1 Tax=Acinetobacter sp. WCHAc010034 TaxID=1879049 RepID=UPI00083A2E80|nr:ExeM/NucH family extracellular endonuclease [Acinetobacter sp. WCHAc010034]AYA04443.1 ExeM/NucH family extracellular endonuclease [Acinetobacter sp. WCHAc010034]